MTFYQIANRNTGEFITDIESPSARPHEIANFVGRDLPAGTEFIVWAITETGRDSFIYNVVATSYGTAVRSGRIAEYL